MLGTVGYKCEPVTGSLVQGVQLVFGGQDKKARKESVIKSLVGTGLELTGCKGFGGRVLRDCEQNPRRNLSPWHSARSDG